MNDARECLHNLLPLLGAAGVHILDFAALDETQKAHVKQYFDVTVYPVLTPLAYDPGRPFPHISNMSLNLAVLLRDEGGSAPVCARESTEHPAPAVKSAASCRRPSCTRTGFASKVSGLAGAGHYRTPAQAVSGDAGA